MQHKPDSILGVVSGWSVSIWFMHSVINLFVQDSETKGHFNADWLLVFGPYIHQNRNELTRQFLETDRDWLLMVDNDMVFTPEDVLSLYACAEDNGPGVYSAAYMIENATMVCGPWDDEREKVYHPMVALPKRPTQVGVVGAGFTLVHREVFETVGEKPWSEIERDSGEDLSFCWRCHEQGIDPWLVPAANPGHFKQVALFPHGAVRNAIGDEVNLVKVDEEQMRPGQIVLPDGSAAPTSEGR